MNECLWCVLCVCVCVCVFVVRSLHQLVHNKTCITRHDREHALPSLARSLTHSLTCSLTHSLAFSLTHSLTHFLTRCLHFLTHSSLTTLTCHSRAATTWLRKAIQDRADFKSQVKVGARAQLGSVCRYHRRESLPLEVPCGQITKAPGL